MNEDRVTLLQFASLYLRISVQSTSDQPMLAQVLEDQTAMQLVEALKLRLAQQIAPRRWKPHLESMAKALESGQPWEEMLASKEEVLPRELQCLAREAVQVADPAMFMLECLKIRTQVRESWHAFALLCIYPLMLYLFAVVVGVAFSYCMKYLIDMRWVQELGLAQIPEVSSVLRDQHHSMLGVALVTIFTLAVVAAIYILGPSWSRVAVFGGVLAIGKPLRWLTMQEILYRYHLFLSHGLPLAETSWAVSRSFASSSQAVVSRAIAQRLHDGMLLGKALASSTLSDGLCRPSLFLMDQRSEDLPRALAENAQLLGRMVERRCQSLGSLVPVFLLLVVGTIIWSAITSYVVAMIPMIYMMRSFLYW